MIQYQHAYDFSVHPGCTEIDFSSASLQASHTCKVNNVAKGLFHIQKMLHVCCMIGCSPLPVFDRIMDQQ